MKVTAMLAKEFRSRMRSWRSLAIITIYLGTLTAIGLGTIMYIRDTGQNTGLQAAATGPLIFGAVAEFQIVLIAFVAPALTGAAIAGEKERQTYELLLVTRLSSFSIIVGKLLTSLAYLLLLLFVSMPVYMLAFLFGGVSLNEFALTQLLLVVTGLALGGLALFISTVVPKPQIATALSYILAFALVLGSGLFGSLLNVNSRASSFTVGNGYNGYNGSISLVSQLPNPPLLTNLSPLAAVATTITTPFGAAVNIPFFQLPTGLPDAYFNFSSYSTYFNQARRITSLNNLSPDSSLPSTTPQFLLIYTVIILFSLGLSVLLLRPQRWLRQLKRIVRSPLRLLHLMLPF